jgi:ribosomal protein S18 acetylase RimI-like enzyme
VNDYKIIERIDAFCDAAPRRRANAEQLGPLVLFVPAGPGWPYYARPRRDLRAAITVADVRRVRARQRELLIPESFEWIAEVTPDLAVVGASAGLVVRTHPLLTLSSLVQPPAPPRATIRIVPPEDPDLIMAWAVPAVAFGYPGTEVGTAGATERDKVAAGHDSGTIALLRERLESGESVLAAAFGPAGPLAAGSYQLVNGVAEITGVGVLPASRQRGLGAAVTAALAADAASRGAQVVFLSATDDRVARIYTRLGFRRIGTAMIAEPPDA